MTSDDDLGITSDDDLRLPPSSGMACHVNHDVLAANLPRLPMEDPVFILSDGVRTLPRTLASGATLAMGSTFYTLAEAAEAAEVMLGGLIATIATECD